MWDKQFKFYSMIFDGIYTLVSRRGKRVSGPGKSRQILDTFDESKFKPERTEESSVKKLRKLSSRCGRPKDSNISLFE